MAYAAILGSWYVPDFIVASRLRAAEDFTPGL